MKCGRCGHRMWPVEEDKVPYAKCICGHLLPLSSTLGVYVVTHICPTPEALLPKQGTKLSRTLGALAAQGTAATGIVAQVVRQTSSDTATQLGVLASRGLVHRVTDRKGVKGGSLWELTDTARTHLNL